MLLPQVFPPCPFSEEVAQACTHVPIIDSYVKSLERMYPGYTEQGKFTFLFVFPPIYSAADILYHLRFAPLTILPFIPHITQLPYDIPALLRRFGGVTPVYIDNYECPVSVHSTVSLRLIQAHRAPTVNRTWDVQRCQRDCRTYPRVLCDLR